MNQQLLRWVNEARQQAGASALQWHPLLAQVAQQHAETMALRGYFDHVDEKGRGVGERLMDAGFNYRWAGENISAGKSDPRAVFEWWMSSESHRQNILKAEFRLMGLGYFFIPQDRFSYHHYWVQVFASGH